MNELLSFLTAWLLDLLVLGTALLGLSALLLVLLRQPAARMALARGTLLGLATLCVLTALPSWPRQPLAEFLSTRAAEEETDGALSLLAETGTLDPAPLAIDAWPTPDDSFHAATSTFSSVSFITLIKLLPLFWLGSAACALSYIFVGACRAFRLLGTAVNPPDWSQQELARLVSPKHRAPRLKTSERIATAVALMAWRPHILLAKGSVTEENKVAVRAALAHEWAHIRHGDLWLLALERLLLPVCCLHPLFWLLRRQVRIDQELLADAAAAGDAPAEYAQALLNWAKVENSVTTPHWGVAALPLWEHPSNLSRRVQMLLRPQPSVPADGHRLWKWLAPLALLAVVLGFSLITFRPAAVAQDGTDIDVVTHPRPERVKKPKKTKLPKPDRKTAVTPLSELSALPHPPSEAQIQIQLLIGQVDHAAIQNSDSSLGDMIQAAAEDQCRLEGNLIVAELNGDKVNSLTRKLKQLGAFDILSRPSIVTVDEQEARVQVGSQVPVNQFKETLNYQNVGELISILPRLGEKDSGKLTLEIEAVHTEIDKKGAAKSGDDTPRFITRKFRLEVEGTIGKTLLIAERDPKRGSGQTTSILLAVTPQTFLPPPPPAATQAEPRTKHSDDLSRLRDENAALRKQVDDLRAKLIDLEVQIRWLRAAAAPGGEKKVSDEEFLRRVYLDLTGLIPTAEETRSFLKDKDPHKRDKLIDKLLEGNAAKKEASSAWKKSKDAIQGEPKTPLSRQESGLGERIWNRLGVKLTALNEGDLKQANSRYRGGLKVLEVRESGPAWQEGICSGDVLVGLHRWETISLENIGFILDQQEVSKDEPVAFYITRGMESLHGQVRLEKPKSATNKSAPQITQDAPDSLVVFNLSRSRAAAAAEVLANVLPQAEGLTVEVDERTNSLILRGSPNAMQKAKTLLEALDRENDLKPNVKDPGQQRREALQRDQKEADLRAAEAALQAANAQYERIQALHNNKAVGEAELDQAVQQLKIAELALETAKNKESIRLREAQLQQVEAALQSSQLTLASVERLVAKGLLSKAQLEGAKSAVDQKKAEFNEARYNLKAIKPKE